MKNWNEKTWGIFVNLLIAMVIIIGVSCGTVNKTNSHGCDLMKNGKKCLADHSCCK